MNFLVLIPQYPKFLFCSLLSYKRAGQQHRNTVFAGKRDDLPTSIKDTSSQETYQERPTCQNHLQTLERTNRKNAMILYLFDPFRNRK